MIFVFRWVFHRWSGFWLKLGSFSLIYIMISGMECDVMYGRFVIWIWCECYFFWYEFDVDLMVKNMTSIEWCCLWVWCSWKVLILLVFWMILILDFGDLLGEILWIECSFWLSSIEALFYKGLRGFWVVWGDFWCCGKWRNAWF